MKVQDNDYVLLNNPSGKGTRLVKVTDSENPKRITGIVDVSHLEAPDKDAKETLEFKKSEVVANLGTEPQFGTSYGFKVETLISRRTHEFFGKVRLYASVLRDDKEVRKLRDLLEKARKMLTKAGLPQLPLIFDVRNPVGKYAGMYKFRSNDLDILTLRVGEDNVNEDWILRYTAHEYAHGIWYRYLSSSVKAKWIDLYNKATAVTSFGKKELNNLMDDMIAAGGPRAFKNELEEEEDKKLLAAILKHIKQTHHMDTNHLQLLVNLEDDISGLWPTYIEMGEPEELITDYARKSPEELFAETMMFWLMGDKLPASLQSAVDRTMKHVRKNVQAAGGEIQYCWSSDRNFAVEGE